MQHCGLHGTHSLRLRCPRFATPVTSPRTSGTCRSLGVSVRLGTVCAKQCRLRHHAQADAFPVSGGSLALQSRLAEQGRGWHGSHAADAASSQDDPLSSHCWQFLLFYVFVVGLFVIVFWMMFVCFDVCFVIVMFGFVCVCFDCVVRSCLLLLFLVVLSFF